MEFEAGEAGNRSVLFNFSLTWLILQGSAPRHRLLAECRHAAKDRLIFDRKGALLRQLRKKKAQGEKPLCFPQ